MKFVGVREFKEDVVKYSNGGSEIVVTTRVVLSRDPRMIITFLYVKRWEPNSWSAETRTC